MADMSTQPMRPGHPRRHPVPRVPDVPRGPRLYEEAQRAVDYLSDHDFPVRDVLIVGTDLKQPGAGDGTPHPRPVIGAGALSGMWLGLFVGTIFALFDPSGFNIVNVLGTVAFGAIFGAIWAMVGYRLTRGQRGLHLREPGRPRGNEVLCEHKHVAEAAAPWRRWTRCGPPRRRSVGPARPRRLGSPASSRCRRLTRARRSWPSRAAGATAQPAPTSPSTPQQPAPQQPPTYP